MVHGKFLGSPNLVAPAATKSCGTFKLVESDELARLLDGLGRAVAVVVGDERHLAAVDAALGVDLVEIGGERAADQAIGGGRTAVGVDVADLDRAVAGAGIVFLLRRGGDRECEHHGQTGQQTKSVHGFAPRFAWRVSGAADALGRRPAPWPRARRAPATASAMRMSQVMSAPRPNAARPIISLAGMSPTNGSVAVKARLPGTKATQLAITASEAVTARPSR